jgi:hypothetical protein
VYFDGVIAEEIAGTQMDNRRELWDSLISTLFVLKKRI